MEMTNHEFSKTNTNFISLCRKLGITPTARQASKFQNKRGQVHALQSNIITKDQLSTWRAANGHPLSSLTDTAERLSKEFKSCKEILNCDFKSTHAWQSGCDNLIFAHDSSYIQENAAELLLGRAKKNLASANANVEAAQIDIDEADDNVKEESFDALLKAEKILSEATAAYETARS